MTPAGTPSTVTLAPTASRTSLAVPSPPTKTRTSIPCLSIDLAIRTVSVLVVSTPTPLTETNSRPSSLAISAPIPPSATTRLIPGFLGSIDRNSFARFGETGIAPLLTASRNTVVPSVPLRPTTPPIPAIGLTMNPILTNFSRFSASLHLNWAIPIS